MRLFSRRRDFERQVQAAVEKSTQAAQAAEAAAARVEAIVNTQDASATADTKRHVLALSLATIASLSLAALITLQGSKAFRDPLPWSEGRYGQVELAWQTDELPTDPALVEDPAANTAEAFVAVEVDEDRGLTTFSVTFPSYAGGREFALILSGRARLTDVVSEETAIRADDGVECGYYEESMDHCQVIYGTIPKVDGFDRRACGPVSSLEVTPNVRISGKSEAITKVDWAHHILVAPRISGPESAYRVYDYKQIDFDGGLFEVANLSGCKSIRVGVDWIPGAVRNDYLEKVTDTSLDPSVAVDGREYRWQEPFAMSRNHSLVTKSRSAEYYGQGLIALGATLAGLGVGLIPVAYSAAGENRRRRKAQAGQNATGPPQ